MHMLKNAPVSTPPNVSVNAPPATWNSSQNVDPAIRTSGSFDSEDVTNTAEEVSQPSHVAPTDRAPSGSIPKNKLRMMMMKAKGKAK